MSKIKVSCLPEAGVPRRPCLLSAAAFATASLLLCAWAAPSLAEDEGPEALIKQGVSLRRTGQESKAYGYFRRAYETAPTPRSAAQFGLSSVAVGNYAEGEWLLSEALASGDPWAVEHAAELNKGRGAARGKLGMITLDGVPADATIAIGGRTLGRVPGDRVVRWTPGLIRVRVEAGGYKPFDGEVTFPAPGHESRLAISMSSLGSPAVATVPPPVSAPAPVAPPTSPVGETETRPDVSSRHPAEDGGVSRDKVGEAETRSSWRRPVFAGALGLGAASVAFGVFETLKYRSSVSDFNNPGRTPLCREGGGTVVGGAECSRLASDGDRAKTLSIVGYAVGGALVTASLILLLTEPPGAPNASLARSDRARRPWSRGRESLTVDSVTIGCTPWLSVGGASCSVRF